MTIEIDEALRAYMEKKGKCTIAVEVMGSQSSDFDFSELYVHLISEGQAAYFKEKKGFHAVAAGELEVLLPNYRLEYDERVCFSLKKTWIFHSVRQSGIRL